jgi:hypothetical protein
VCATSASSQCRSCAGRKSEYLGAHQLQCHAYRHGYATVCEICRGCAAAAAVVQSPTVSHAHASRILTYSIHGVHDEPQTSAQRLEAHKHDKSQHVSQPIGPTTRIPKHSPGSLAHIFQRGVQYCVPKPNMSAQNMYTLQTCNDKIAQARRTHQICTKPQGVRTSHNIAGAHKSVLSHAAYTLTRLAMIGSSMTCQ